ncbi:UPF0052-domain-containing protein [Testicularia cyperi]|uniref:UPF0052-domain-containing protein n=1 Tax=Testicularia cyperi TaxID=1882483 RepID=A0A317XJL5_9BASI|nr:UPF0052-domain-containing protein [Testicularia cyperi]
MDSEGSERQAIDSITPHLTPRVHPDRSDQRRLQSLPSLSNLDEYVLATAGTSPTLQDSRGLDDETSSLGRSTDVDLDSTGAGSPVHSSRDLAELDEHIASAPTLLDARLNSPNVARGMEATTKPNSSTSSGVLMQASPLGPGSVLVISGGSGFNDLVGATPGATYVMPISDNGGSSSEIIRVLGGPSIGDLRSRLNRLIPLASRPGPGTGPSEHHIPPPHSNEALHNLLSYRLPTKGKSREIKQEWMDILEGRHHLWRGIEPERKEVIRGFLVHFESEVLRRAHRHFNFRGGSIGNFFLAAAQKFFRSIQSAIFLFSATTHINASETGSKVLPVINTNHTATIAAELEDGEIIVGQCEISHPAPKPLLSSASRQLSKLRGTGMEFPGSLTSQPPGTPSSAIFDSFGHGSDGIEARGHIYLSGSPAHHDPALLTPGFGPPAHYAGQGLGTSYESMSGSGILSRPVGGGTPQSVTGDASPAGRQAHHQHLLKPATGASPLFARLVEEKAAAYATSRKGLTRVGNYKDGLEPDEDEQDSQDGIDDGVGGRATEGEGDGDEDAPERAGNIVFSKADGDDADQEPQLPSKIQRIFYVNAYRDEIHPAPNPSFVSTLVRSQTLIYSCGSLWTSIIPCLCLRGVATAIARSSTLRYKVLLLNSVHDRETNGMSALDVVNAISSSLNHSDNPALTLASDLHGYQPSSFITHIVYFPDGQIKVDIDKFEALGIQCVIATSSMRTKSGYPKFDEDSVRQALSSITGSSAP